MLSRIDHVNLVVTDLDRMIDFYTILLGLKVTKRVTISGDWVAATVGLAEVHADVVYLELPEGPRIELIRYNAPALQRPADIDRPNAPGLRHFAFAVSDIDGIVSRLRERGVKFFSDIQSVPTTQVTYAGGVRKRIVYFQDPEGNLLELCEYR
ncbi:MAG TPA: VOC family protein [Tepidisphaeraceae bacterium]|jgi:catechol 2,3-dioxygenase-like lactoylglutathione lyase family enzyme